MNSVLKTERLRLRPLVLDDAAFIYELVNDPDWLRFVGDRGVRNLDDARAYLQKGPIAHHEQHGFGMFTVEPKGGGEALGVCGLIRREALPDVDVGYGFLPRARGNGYARESVRAVLDFGRDVLGFKRILAMVQPEHERSVHLLERLGFVYERSFRMPGEDVDLSLYLVELTAKP